ncbi:hypothetical protein DL98DRAFT_542680 [Cadophora sp. DSE1049]|nr:hypothetical protein DL98DRAFT_542680 [Cadophora sp. DSE1049]
MVLGVPGAKAAQQATLAPGQEIRNFNTSKTTSHAQQPVAQQMPVAQPQMPMLPQKQPSPANFHSFQSHNSRPYPHHSCLNPAQLPGPTVSVGSQELKNTPAGIPSFSFCEPARDQWHGSALGTPVAQGQKTRGEAGRPASYIKVKITSPRPMPPPQSNDGLTNAGGLQTLIPPRQNNSIKDSTILELAGQADDIIGGSHRRAPRPVFRFDEFALLRKLIFRNSPSGHPGVLTGCRTLFFDLNLYVSQ